MRKGPDHITGAISSLLSDIGCVVEIVPDDGQSGIKSFCGHVKAGGFDIGVSIEDTCEKMLLVDALGRLITEDMFMALVSLVILRKIRGNTVVVPVPASQAIECWLKSIRAVLYEGRLPGISWLSCSQETKEELLEQFTCISTQLSGLMKLLDFMKTNNTNLHEMADMLPKIHVRGKEVECSWEAKGK